MSVEVDGPRFKEIEIMAAEMETRLRDSVLRVLRPTLAQVSELELRQQELLSRIDEQANQIDKVDGLESNVVKQGQLTKLLEDAVMSASNQISDLETATGKQFVDLKSSFDASQMALTAYRNDVLRLSREDTRIWDEATRLQQQHDEDVRNHRDLINGCHKRIARVREEFEGHIIVINKQREQLMEDLWGEGRGLNQLNRDLKQLSDFVAPIPEMMRQIANNERAVQKMAKRQSDFEQEFVQNRTDWQEYVKKQDVALVEMKADFKKQCNHLVAHNAEIMKDIRKDYTKEMAYIQETRLGIAKTLHQLGQTLEVMEEKLSVERRRIDVIHGEITKEIEDLQRWRSSDRAFMESDIRQFRSDLKQEVEGQSQLRSQVEHVVRLIGVVLESCRVNSALNVQDYADRSGERWLCFTGEQMKASEPWKTSDLEKKLREDPRMNEDPIIDLKSRGGVVRTGYTPGQVFFGGRSYDRRDLLLLHGKLLAKAQQAYSREEEVPKAVQGVQGVQAQAGQPPATEEKLGYPKRPQGIRILGRGGSGEKPGKALDMTKLPEIHSARGKEGPPKVATPPTSRPGTGND